MNELLNNEVLNEEVTTVQPVDYEIVEMETEVEETESKPNTLLIGAAITAAVVGVGFGVKKFKQWKANKKIKEEGQQVYEVATNLPPVEEQSEVKETTETEN